MLMSATSSVSLLLWHLAEVSSSGRPKLLSGEIEIRSFDRVGICLQEGKKVTQELLSPVDCTVTNCRIICLEASKSIARHILLSNVLSVEDCKAFLSASKRAAVKFSPKDHIAIPGFSNSSNNSSNNSNSSSSSSSSSSKPVGDTIDFGLRFNSNADKDEFISVINDQLKRKAWMPIISQQLKVASSSSSISGGGGGPKSGGVGTADATASLGLRQPNSTDSASTVSIAKGGISAIVKKQEQEIKEVKNLSQQAMGDLVSLMSNAQEVVAIIERYSQFMESRAKEKEESGLDPETSSINSEAFKMEEIMQNIGIISPVTRLSAGRLYHQQLSRQIADLLIEKFVLRRFGGVITLTDLYCLVNRARGTELLSPTDFHAACELMNTLNLDIRFKTFPSGVKVIISHEQFSDDAIRVKLLGLVNDRFERERKGVHAVEVAQDLSLSIVIAVELLFEVEKKGLICRDDNINGLSFYMNRF